MTRGVLLLVLGGAVLSAATAAAFVGSAGPSGATASSHREAPLIADANENAFLASFPYVAPPNQGYAHTGHE